MQLVVEISLYPLAEQYIGPIQGFIDRLNMYPDIAVKTGATSTLIKGEYAQVMAILADEMARTHAEVGQAIFVCKFLYGDHIDINARY